MKRVPLNFLCGLALVASLGLPSAQALENIALGKVVTANVAYSGLPETAVPPLSFDELGSDLQLSWPATNVRRFLRIDTRFESSST